MRTRNCRTSWSECPVSPETLSRSHYRKCHIWPCSVLLRLLLSNHYCESQSAMSLTRLRQGFAMSSEWKASSRRAYYCAGVGCKLMMYAMTLSRSFSATRKFGIVGWDVWSHTASARPVIPGVFATLAKVGALGFGDLTSVSVMAWHSAQFARANVSPARESPGSCALTHRGNIRAKNTANLEDRMDNSPNLKPKVELR